MSTAKGLLLFAAALAGCNVGFTPVDGGVDMQVVTCSSTTVRGFEPLGLASSASVGGALAPAGAIVDGNGMSQPQMGMVWEKAAASTTAGDGTLYYTRVGPLGSPDAAGPMQIGPGQNPFLFRIGESLTLFYRVGTAITMQKLDDSGAAVGGGVTVYPSTSPKQLFSVAWSGSLFAIFLTGIAGDDYQSYLLLADKNGAAMGTPALVPRVGPNSIQPVIDWTGSQFALAWTDVRSGTPAIFAAMYDGHGKRKSGDDVQLSAAGTTGTFPSVAAQASGGAVVCYQQKVTDTKQELWCSRLDQGGAITNQVNLSANEYSANAPSVVQHGRLTWVSWAGYNTTSDPGDIVWQFLDENGAAVLAQPFDSTINYAFNPHGYGNNVPLFELHYAQTTTGKYEAEVLTVNCF